MSGVVINEAIVAIENRAKYVFKFDYLPGDGDSYLVILKNLVNPIQLQPEQLAPTAKSVLKNISLADDFEPPRLPQSP